MHIWETTTWSETPVKTLDQKAPVTSVAFSSQGNRLVATSDSVDLYDTNNWDTYFSLHDATEVKTAVFDPKSELLTMGGGGLLAKVRNFDMQDHLLVEHYTLDKLITTVWTDGTNKPLLSALLVRRESNSVGQHAIQLTALGVAATGAKRHGGESSR